MKKLTTLCILLFIGGVFFAEPKFPKYTLNDDNAIPYVYVSNDLQSVYEIKAYIFPSKKTALSFIKKSLILPTGIYITIEFSNEKKLDDFLKNIDLSDLENCFNKTRQRLIKEGFTPDILVYDKNEKPRPITETKTDYGYGYDEHFDWKNVPSNIIYRVSY